MNKESFRSVEFYINDLFDYIYNKFYIEPLDLPEPVFKEIKKHVTKCALNVFFNYVTKKGDKLTNKKIQCISLVSFGIAFKYLFDYGMPENFMKELSELSQSKCTVRQLKQIEREILKHNDFSICPQYKNLFNK